MQSQIAIPAQSRLCSVRVHFTQCRLGLEVRLCQLNKVPHNVITRFTASEILETHFSYKLFIL